MCQVFFLKSGQGIETNVKMTVITVIIEETLSVKIIDRHQPDIPQLMGVFHHLIILLS